MKKSSILAGVALAALAFGAQAAPLEPGCHNGFTVTHSGPGAIVGGSGILTARGVPPREGGVAVHNLDALPYGTKITIPELYGESVLTVDDFASDDNNDLIVVWHDNPADAVGITPNTKICIKLGSS